MPTSKISHTNLRLPRTSHEVFSSQLSGRFVLPRVSPKDRKRLERDIAFRTRGQRGAAQVRFELANSHLPIRVVQDLYLEHNGLNAQIDFLVVTPYAKIIIECKNLVGDIEVDERGNFTRALSRGRREGMYSPVTQNERHLALMSAIALDEADGLMRLGRRLFYEQSLKSLIVLAEDKSVLRCSKAPKEVREQVIRKDELVRRIADIDKGFRRRGDFALTRKEMEAVARGWLEKSCTRPFDVEGRYRLVNTPSPVVSVGPKPAAVPVPIPVSVIQKKGPMPAPVPASSPAPPPMPVPMSTLAPVPAPTFNNTVVVTTPGTPLCPRCGAPMVLRTARRGQRAGKQFWGCSTYPKCRGIVNVG